MALGFFSRWSARLGPEGNARRRLPSRKTLVIGGVVLLVLLIVGVNIYKIKNPPGVEVTTAKVEKRRLQSTVIANGKVRTQNPEVIFAAAGGKVKDVLVKVGQEVEPGEILARLDDEQLVIQAAQAEAALALAEANEQRTRESTGISEVAQAEANLSQYEAALDNAKKKMESSETLFQAGIISQEEFDAARLDFEVKQSQYNLAKEQLPAARAGSSASLKASVAQTAQARAAYEQALYKLEHATLKSAFGGRVLQMDIKSGDMVMPDQQLVVVGTLDKLEIEAEVSEVDAGRLRIGQAVEITSAASERAKQAGKVVAVAPQAVTRVKNGGEQTVVPVIVLVEGENRLIPGTNADLTITTGLEESTLTVPFEALLENDAGSQVYVVQNGVAQLRNISVGLSDDTYLQVLSGVEDGETVILNPPEEIEDGVNVKPQPTELDDAG